MNLTFFKEKQNQRQRIHNNLCNFRLDKDTHIKIYQSGKQTNTCIFQDSE